VGKRRKKKQGKRRGEKRRKSPGERKKMRTSSTQGSKWSLSTIYRRG
jgi:hypothetical protein